jgi:hypothetical protein
MTDEELMAFCQEWLDTPSLQKNPHWRPIGYIADVCRYWRTKKSITVKQRQYVEAILSKHTHK